MFTSLKFVVIGFFNQLESVTAGSRFERKQPGPIAACVAAVIYTGNSVPARNNHEQT
jgi:hypothetical protein